MAKSIHQSDGKDTASLAPTPPKKRKTIHQDYFWEFIENQSEKSILAEEEETVRGMSEAHYKLAAISSFCLASKVYQSGNGIHPPYAFAQLTQNQFSAKQIDDMELCILKILNFRVHVPTSLRFVQEMLPLLITDVVGNGGSRFALDSRPWSPRDTLEASIYSKARHFVLYASSYAATDFDPIISATSSKIALAAIMEAAIKVYYKKKLLGQQHAFYERLRSLEGILPYDEEVLTIQKCLAKLRRLSNRRVLSRQDSPASVDDSTLGESKVS